MKKLFLVFALIIMGCGEGEEEKGGENIFYTDILEVGLHTSSMLSYYDETKKRYVTLEKEIINGKTAENSDVVLTVLFQESSENGDICGRGGNGKFYGEEVEFTDKSKGCRLGAGDGSVGAFMHWIEFESFYDLGYGKVPIKCVFRSDKHACITDSEGGDRGCFASEFSGICQEITDKN